MDAGKIRNLVPAVDMRAGSGAATHSGRHTDADLLVQKVAPLLALDSLMEHAPADPAADVPGVPRTSVVVDLSLPAVNAQAARQLARSLANVTDYSHLDPHKAHPDSVEGPTGLQEAIEPPFATPALQGGASAHPAAPGATEPGVRPDLHPHGVAHASPATWRSNVGGAQSARSAITDARDTERLSGLALAAERVAASPTQLGTLALAAAALGAFVVILLA